MSLTGAVAVSAAAGLPTKAFVSTQRLTTLCSFFADDDTLALVANDTGRPRDADLALAYGLAYRGDRDLAVVLPEVASDATLRRAAWIDPPVRVFSYGESGVREQPLPARAEVLAMYQDRVRPWAPAAG